VSWIPSVDKNNSPAKWGALPMPVEANVNLPGVISGFQ
jgi:hypothetical protein